KRVRWGLGAKLFVVSLALIAACVVVADAHLTRGVDAWASAHVQDDLAIRARVAARESAMTGAAPDDLAAWDGLADSLGKTLDARVTFIRKDGVVVGDSDVDLAAIPHVENHATRPEVAAALAGGVGANERLSDTIHRRFSY